MALEKRCTDYYSMDLNSDIKKVNNDNLNSDFSNKPEILDL